MNVNYFNKRKQSCNVCITNFQTLHLKFTKIMCNVTDNTFFAVDMCRVKAESRNLQYIKLYIQLLQIPVNEFSIRLRFLKRANGYKPFLYDFTVDCSFIKHLNPVSKLVWGWVKDVSNINHSCPITEDLDIKRLENHYLEQQLSALPLANGDYALFINYCTSNVSRIHLQIYATSSKSVENTLAFRLKLTKIKCNVLDNTFVKFQTCRVKAESRDLQYIKLYIQLLQLPLQKVQARFWFLKRANGYKPFLYDFTFKCDFIKHLNPITSILWRWFNEVSNLNHSCPLTEDFEIKRLENRYLEKELGILPILSGDYAMFASLDFQNETKFSVEFYGTIF
ncbi:hypothetical protein CVS40_5443 [Lucilia cuprina]|nr:hypothetical protein CVS40_5443 [Lucilia cuprina]